MMEKNWIWLPVPSLIICAHRHAGWGMRTYVKGHIISTVRISTPEDRYEGMAPLPPFESVVFTAVENDGVLKEYGVPYKLGEIVSDEIKYLTLKEASEGHLKLCNDIENKG